MLERKTIPCNLRNPQEFVAQINKAEFSSAILLVLVPEECKVINPSYLFKSNLER